MRILNHLSSLFFGVILLVMPAISLAGFNFEGFLADSNDTPITGSGISVRLKVYSPGSEACLLYDETHSVTTSDGYVSLSIGSGTRNDALSHSISAAFANHAAFTGLTCSSGTSYTPVAGAGRKLSVTVNSELLGTLDMNPVPMSIGAEKLGHLTASNVMRVESSGVAQTVTALTSAQYTEFSALIAGTSTKYLQKNAAAGSTLPVVSSGTPASAVAGSIWYDSTANAVKYYNGTTDLTLSSGGAGLSAGTAFSGDVSGTYNALALANTGVSAGSYSKVTVDAKGRVLSGSQIASSDITAAIGFTPMNKSGDTLTGVLGLYSTPSDPSSGWSVAEKGRTWFDSSANQIKYWDGSSVQSVGAAGGGITSMNGATSSSQTFTITNDNAIAAPQINTASSLHTWKYPMASASGVTAGLISKTEYDLFYNKLDSGTPFSGDVSGTMASNQVVKLRGYPVSSSTPSAGQLLFYDGSQYTPLSLSGDATLSGSGFLNITNVSVSKGGTGVSSFSANQVIVANGTGSALQAFTCSVGQILSFDASGWAQCQTIEALGAFVNGGNSLGSSVSFGTNDTFPVHFETNGVSRMTLESNGKVGIGTSSPTEKLHIAGGGGSPPRVLIENNTSASSADGSRVVIKNHAGSYGTFPTLSLENARGAWGSPTQMNSGDIIGEIMAGPYDGASNTASAKISFVAAETIGVSMKGTQMGFWTANTGSPSISEKMRLTANGQLLVGTTTSDPYAKLLVQGTIVSQQSLASGAVADFAYGNSLVLTTVPSSSISLSGMAAGGHYTLVIEDTTSRSYSFSGCTTVKMVPASSPTSGASIFKIYYGGSNYSTCFINWTTGY